MFTIDITKETNTKEKTKTKIKIYTIYKYTMQDTAKQTITIENPEIPEKNQYPKLVNQGTYGCVYKPSFLCDGNTLKEEDYITKIQTKDDVSTQEETIGTLVQSIPNHAEHYAGIINTCPIELSKIEDNELKKCEFWKSNN